MTSTCLLAAMSLMASFSSMSGRPRTGMMYIPLPSLRWMNSGMAMTESQTAASRPGLGTRPWSVTRQSSPSRIT